MKRKLLTDKGPVRAAREVEPQEFLREVRELILAARQTVARAEMCRLERWSVRTLRKI